MKYTLLIFSVILALISCNRLSQTEKELRKTIDKHLCYDLIETVRQGNTFLTLADLKQQYDYLSVVYLQNGCRPCYPKFIEWHRRMEQIATADDYTVLFVINARDYTSFTRNINLHEAIEEKYYYFIDPRNAFFRANSGIS